MGLQKTESVEAGLALSKLVSKLEAGNRILEKTSIEFPGRASIRASTTLNVRLTKVKKMLVCRCRNWYRNWRLEAGNLKKRASSFQGEHRYEHRQP